MLLRLCPPSAFHYLAVSCFRSFDSQIVSLYRRPRVIAHRIFQRFCSMRFVAAIDSKCPRTDCNAFILEYATSLSSTSCGCELMIFCISMLFKSSISPLKKSSLSRFLASCGLSKNRTHDLVNVNGRTHWRLLLSCGKYIIERDVTLHW